jgi:thiamine-monophosphate kinase
MALTLSELGEREIIRSILPKFTAGIGDDCAIVKLGGKELILTTDPVPEPAAKLIGGDPDPYWMGWLLVVINASDLAAAAARPLAFTAAIEAPSTLPVGDFERLLLGVSEACANEGLRYVGGNLREGQKLTAVGNAVGLTTSGKSLTRKGAQSGDIIASIGIGGIFWRDALASLHRRQEVSKDNSPLFRPKSQVRLMNLLAKQRLISAAMDNSDGLLPTLTQLAASNSLAIRVDLALLPVPENAHEVIDDPVRLWLGWGDWNVISAIPKRNIKRAMEITNKTGGTIIPIGEFVTGEPCVELRRDGETQVAPRLESERFSKDSWFTTGIQGYIDLLLGVELPGKAT